MNGSQNTSYGLQTKQQLIQDLKDDIKRSERVMMFWAMQFTQARDSMRTYVELHKNMSLEADRFLAEAAEEANHGTMLKKRLESIIPK